MTIRPSILVVDDELGVRESLRAILSQDCDVRTAESGDDALSIVDECTIDLVTLDLRMPGMGGISVLEAIKSKDPEIEVLIVTGYGSFDTAVQGLRHRAFDYISKPFDSNQIRRLVQAALARRTATQRLKSAPDNILATLSHEFRTPLNVIMGYSTMLKEEDNTELSDEQQLALDRIEANSTALLSYVETLFYLIELDRGTVSSVPTSVPVLETTNAVLKRVEHQASGKGLTLCTEGPDDLVVLTDADMFERITLALADNAVRYTSEGTVVVSATPLPEGIRLQVMDTGVGMNAEAIAEAYAIVEGTPTGQAPRLLGFGLRLVARLVRLLGGSLAIRSSGAGTTCEVIVPHYTDQMQNESTVSVA